MSIVKVQNLSSRYCKSEHRVTTPCFDYFTTVTSGRSRIFPGGAPTPKIAIIFHIFAENCMKMKEFGPPGGRTSLAPPLGSANGNICCEGCKQIVTTPCFDYFTTVTSGRSRIFPGGAPTPKIAIIFHIFAENCMKMKEFGPPGGRTSLAPPLGSANGNICCEGCKQID